MNLAPLYEKTVPEDTRNKKTYKKYLLISRCLDSSKTDDLVHDNYITQILTFIHLNLVPSQSLMS